MSQIRAMRGLHRLTQQQLADLLDVSRRRVQMWEAGEDEPRLAVLACERLSQMIAAGEVQHPQPRKSNA